MGTEIALKEGRKTANKNRAQRAFKEGTKRDINNTITDGGVALQCSFARPTRNTDNTDSQRTLRNKKI